MTLTSKSFTSFWSYLRFLKHVSAKAVKITRKPILLW